MIKDKRLETLIKMDENVALSNKKIITCYVVQLDEVMHGDTHHQLYASMKYYKCVDKGNEPVATKATDTANNNKNLLLPEEITEQMQRFTLDEDQYTNSTTTNLWRLKAHQHKQLTLSTWLLTGVCNKEKDLCN